MLQLELEEMVTSPGATEREIEMVEFDMGVRLPEVYKQLLNHSNGLSTEESILLYATGEIAERNATWEVKEYADGYVAIGDNGGGSVFLMSQEATEKTVLIVDAGDMNPANAEIITSNFLAWVQGGCVIEEIEIEEEADDCAIFLVQSPSGGLKDLLEIKRVLEIELFAGDLLKVTKNLPYLLAAHYPSAKAKRCIEQLGPISESLALKF